MVVMPDADMGQVVDAVMGAAYGSAGERCMAVSVVVTVGSDTADRLMAQLKPRIEALKVGAYDQSDVEMGPVITPDARDRIKGYIDQGIDEGADLVNSDIWAAVVSDSTLEGVARELAMNMAPVGYDGNVLIVTIDAAVSDLYNKDRQTLIENAISEKLGRSLILRLLKSSEESLETETPVANRLRHAAEAKAEAYQTLMQDPTVQEVIERFDATVVPESVQPGSQRG